jgi:hypothetical protein
VGGRYVGAEPVYVGGRWIEISYGRPRAFFFRWNS